MVSVLVDEGQEKRIKFKRKSIGYSPNNGGDVNRVKELKTKREHTGDDTFIETDEGSTPESLGLIVKRVLENGSKG